MNNKPIDCSSIQLLVVDDSLLLRNLVSDLLLKAGFRVFNAADGQEAWDLLQKESIDLVVTDISMPRLNGLELIQRVRTGSNLPFLPIILMSATDVDVNRQRGLASGANAFIIKERRDLESLARTIIQILQTEKHGKPDT